MLAVSWSAAFFLKRRHSLPKPLALLMVPMALSGWLATLAGWYTTEIGRQPWVVYGLLRTRDAVSAHGAGPLALTLGLFIVVYFFVFGIGTAYVLRLVRKGPKPYEGGGILPGGPGQDRQQMRPISAADDGHDNRGRS